MGAESEEWELLIENNVIFGPFPIVQLKPLKLSNRAVMQENYRTVVSNILIDRNYSIFSCFAVSPI